MFRVELPFTEAYLIFSPRLGFGSRFFQLGILAGLFAVLAFLVLRLYRNELRIVNRRAALLLLALRMVLIAVLFLLTTTKPSLARTFSETVPSTVLIALDRSDSMDVTDPQRSAAETIRLAKSLKLADGLGSGTDRETWLRNAEAGRPIEDAAFGSLQKRIDALTRKQIQEAALSPEGGNLLKQIADKHAVDLIGFNQQAGDLPPLWEKLRPVLSAPDAKSGNALTDLKQPLIRAIERGGGGEGKLLGVVVLTDGQHNWGQGPGLRAAEAAERGLPVYFLAMGAKDPPPDVAILSVKATPPNVFKNAYATVEVRVLVNNLPPGKLKVTLKYPPAADGSLRDPLVEEVKHDGGNGPRLVTFQARMDKPGMETLTAEAELIPDQAQDPRKDLRPDNNTRSVVINVSPDKAKVLLVDGEIRWEFHYLHTALIRDDTLDTTSVVFDQPRINALGEEAARQSGLPDLRLPADPEGLMAYDCIILGDVSPDSLTKPEREKLERYVSERGGTLVMLAGKRSMPMQYLDEGEPLAKLLPISAPRIVNRSAGFKVALTAEGLQTGFLRLDPNPGVSIERWEGLPRHYWAVAGRAKDGAVTLAHVPPEGAGGAGDDERNNALIVRRNHGFGKCVYVGIDSTWRWRFKKGDEYNHRFWSQVIRWAASDRALTAGNEFVRFGTREPVYAGDQEVEVLARLSDKVKKLAADEPAGARLIRKGKHPGMEEVVGLIPLKPGGLIPNELEGAQRNLPPGDYQMELVIPGIEEKLNGPDGKKLRAPFQVIPAETAEMIDLSTNWFLMEDVAAKTGGKVFPADRVQELVDLLQSRSAVREYAIEQKAWQSWWTLGFMVFLLTLEWVIRKLAGLP